ncbi:MAG: arsenite methyltransferase [Planctomycetes bacterium]|nr:arsenite methyltransferase [Planctomycetota bacterium]
MKAVQIKKAVKNKYGKIAAERKASCRPINNCSTTESPQCRSKQIGYTESELRQIPENANLGLGCGNPLGIASLKKGEIVLDLGSGAGIDCFLAANRVGKTGKVIGIDMTPEMIERAKINAQKGIYKNVEFVLGEIEKIPLDNGSVDVVISNCVINLSTNKDKVFKESFRIIKSGGRLMVSDIVLLKKLPKQVKNSINSYTGCISGAIMKNKYLEKIGSAGFKQIRIVSESPYSDSSGVEMSSISVFAVRP